MGQGQSIQTYILLLHLMTYSQNPFTGVYVPSCHVKLCIWHCCETVSSVLISFTVFPWNECTTMSFNRSQHNYAILCWCEIKVWGETGVRLNQVWRSQPKLKLAWFPVLNRCCVIPSFSGVASRVNALNKASGFLNRFSLKGFIVLFILYRLMFIDMEIKQTIYRLLKPLFVTSTQRFVKSYLSQ